MQTYSPFHPQLPQLYVHMHMWAVCIHRGFTSSFMLFTHMHWMSVVLGCLHLGSGVMSVLGSTGVMKTMAVRPPPLHNLLHTRTIRESLRTGRQSMGLETKVASSGYCLCGQSDLLPLQVLLPCGLSFHFTWYHYQKFLPTEIIYNRDFPPLCLKNF